MDNSEAKLEIIRLQEKLKEERGHADNKRKQLESVNYELRTSIKAVDGSLRQENKSREEYLVTEFTNEIERMHKEQASEILVLCQRIDSLKTKLA